MNKSFIISAFILCAPLCAVANNATNPSSALETKARIVNDVATDSINSGSSAKISASSITLFNYVLNKKVSIQKPYELNIMDGGQFVPQIHEFLELYAKHTASGVRPIEAIMLVHTSDLAIDFVKKASNSAIKK